jgi:hypothetical protein
VNLRHSARAVILDDNDRVLLCRFAIPHPAVPAAGARYEFSPLRRTRHPLANRD